MNIIEEILDYNKNFVEEKKYEAYKTTKYPDKKLAILTCMDTRLIELLPAALGIRNGDAKIIKNAGGVISHPYGSVVRSLLVAILELGVDTVMVIAHTDCGVQQMDSGRMLAELKVRGVSEETLEGLHRDGVDYSSWLRGFSSPEESVRESVACLKEHPLIPKDVVICGFVMDSVTGELAEVR
ncbi:carbonic anhydrase [Faecalicatena orotica]|jgi:carbonic anhydrase|uniref:beta-class carbonic anhydrase n=1 Tax=Clostridium sp. AF19-22AC TaxID=2292204 RepID=UPI0026BE77BA